MSKFTAEESLKHIAVANHVKAIKFVASPWVVSIGFFSFHWFKKQGRRPEIRGIILEATEVRMRPLILAVSSISFKSKTKSFFVQAIDY